MDNLSTDTESVPSRPDIALNERENALLAVLQTNRGKVLARTELARRAGLRDLQPRRVDALLVNVRRIAGDQLVNVRGRGWMLAANSCGPAHSHAGASESGVAQ
jgi:DNA-binding response OmpR family regulator